MEQLKIINKIIDSSDKIIGCIAVDSGGNKYKIRKRDLLNYKFSNAKVTKDLKIRVFDEEVEKVINRDMILYHGSHLGIKGSIQHDLSREKCDFGLGFYTGDNTEQVKALITDDENGVLYKMRVSLDEFKVYEFKSGIKWALYVGVNRGRIDAHGYNRLERFVKEVNSYDVVIGPIADDRMMFIYSEFIDGNITDEALIKCISYVKLGNQYVFKSRRACNAIQIVNSRALSTEEIKVIQHNKNILLGDIGKDVEEIKRKYRGKGNYIDEVLMQWR